MRFSTPRRRLAVLVTLLCVCQAVGGASVAAAVDEGGVVNAQATDTPMSTPTNNSSVQQEDPDEVQEDGDTAAVRDYLAERLAERLGDSADQISQGQYEQGESVLGDQYDDLLEKCVDVEGES